MILKLDNIEKTYQNSSSVERTVLNKLNFEVNKADSIAIIGPSGSGKSTMLNLLGILDKPTKGRVIFKDNDISNLNEDALADIRNKNIGFVFQQHHLLPQLSMLENILLPLMAEKNNKQRNEAHKYALELIEMVGLKGKENQLPSQLSVGECQRTAVVRALINKPEVLLADEPTGSLDESSAKNLVALLNEVNEKQHIAVIMVTHSNDLAAKMKTTYKLHEGQLVLV